MKVLLAPDSFKGSLTSLEVSEAMELGIRATFPDARIEACPLADGGEGTVDCVLRARGGERRSACVTGPLGCPVIADWGMLNDGRTAVIEMAAAAGLALVPDGERDPMRTTTYGVGELVREALGAGARKIIVGLGGSSTSDGGAGAAQALGLYFEGGTCPMSGGALVEVDGIDRAELDPRLGEVELLAATDVDNPLLGSEGAAAVYARQKGASERQVMLLEQGLARLNELVGGSWAQAAGSGAAGGLAFGLVALCGARLRRGVDLIFELVRFDDKLSGCDLVLTGEGKLDATSLRGKVVGEVARRANPRGIAVVAIVGSAEAGGDALLREGLSTCLPLVDRGVTQERALAEAPRLVAERSAEAARAFLDGREASHRQGDG